ncbi:DivIVA domain-containing protein [Kineococcus rubinsiae]|uniref:DivIVA domain-containing protein n=1 Tax=Kineococcus rubinsiae TaxID=2609562 RepID=UPI00142FA4D6|nr:DivIVA domain-containing protein [Kineococcus rubinsiae]NIZ91548.1 DivIVA domain-containing protein [Kineococcus rubinsiae]
MSGDEQPESPAEWRLTPSVVQDVRFNRATRMHPGYADSEVDTFLARIQTELQRLVAEKAELREQVHALRWAADERARQEREAREAADAEGVGAEGVVDATPPPPARDEVTVQAVHILAAAQQTADQYVAEAEDFSRRLAQEAREHHEKVVQEARAEADTVLRQAAALAAVAREATPVPERDTKELQEEVAYLKAFGQACRTQLRSYLEALLDDVEHEWGRADPHAVTPRAPRPPATVDLTAVEGPAAQRPTAGASPDGAGASPDGAGATAVNGSTVVDVR